MKKLLTALTVPALIAAGVLTFSVPVSAEEIDTGSGPTPAASAAPAVADPTTAPSADPDPGPTTVPSTDPAPNVEPPTVAEPLQAEEPTAPIQLVEASRSRYSGADRYEVAMSISQEWPAGVPVVYLAKGSDYPDALSAGPAAVRGGGPLLLTLSDRLPGSVLTELQRLAPKRVVIVGGLNSVSSAVEADVRANAPDAEVLRIAGADRYEVSRNLVQYAFAGEQMSRLYVATGATFPDALSASSAAGSAGGAVLLVNGRTPNLDPAVGQAIAALNPQQIVVAGGPNSVPESVKNDLASFASTSRVGGADRYEASVNINALAFPAASRVFLATGSTFADALAGGVLAGSLSAPLFVVPGTCVTQGIADQVNGYGATQRIILGGPNSVSDAVASMYVCPPPPVVTPPTTPQPPTPPQPPVVPNPGDTKNCSDFPDYAAAKAWFDTYYPRWGDIAKLDQDNDLIPCESLRGAP
jgi:putative cell wall-binding protein